MSTTATPTHQVSVAVAHARHDLASVADAPVWSMTDQEAADALVELTRHEAQVAELKARIAVHADEQQVGQDRGASSTAVWLANQTRITRPAAHSVVKLGKELSRRPRTRQALASAAICEQQARVILHWIGTLPDDLDPALVAKVEEHLLALAKEHDAKPLNRLGKRLWEVIAPEEADAHEAEILAREEASAAKATTLKIIDDGHGKTRITGVVPTYVGAAFKKIVVATMAAKHQNATKGAGHGPEQMGQAFCDLITRLPAKALPKTGGMNATLVVLISEDSLMGRLEQAGILDTGERISPDLARRLACEVGILPMVLNGKSQVLDAGRERRGFSKIQRIAIGVQQHFQCAAHGCDRSTGLHAHHRDPWSHGGRSDLDNAIGLCHWHHMRAHDPTYDMRERADGGVSFHRRTSAELPLSVRRTVR